MMIKKLIGNILYMYHSIHKSMYFHYVAIIAQREPKRISFNRGCSLPSLVKTGTATLVKKSSRYVYYPVVIPFWHRACFFILKMLESSSLRSTFSQAWFTRLKRTPNPFLATDIKKVLFKKIHNPDTVTEAILQSYLEKCFIKMKSTWEPAPGKNHSSWNLHWFGGTWNRRHPLHAKKNFRQP